LGNAGIPWRVFRHSNNCTLYFCGEEDYRRYLNKFAEQPCRFCRTSHASAPTRSSRSCIISIAEREYWRKSKDLIMHAAACSFLGTSMRQSITRKQKSRRAPGFQF
jgi:hypothetical protein